MAKSKPQIKPKPLQWKRGVPTEKECQECWLIDGYSDRSPCFHNIGDVYKPGETIPDDWNGEEWFIAIQIDMPKTEIVLQRKYTTKDGEELWTHLAVPPNNKWSATDETRTREVLCE